MGANIKYRMLGASGQANLVWADAADTTELEATACSIGSIGTIAGDPDKLYIFNGVSWDRLDKPSLLPGSVPEYDGINPITLLAAMKLLQPSLLELNDVMTQVFPYYREPAETMTTDPAALTVGMVVYDETAKALKVLQDPGAVEKDTITVTQGAVTQNGNITVTLNNVAKTAAVLKEETEAQVAAKILALDFEGWDAAYGEDVDEVVFTAQTVGTRVAPVLADTGVTGVTGTAVATQAGAAATWITLADMTATFPLANSQLWRKTDSGNPVSVYPVPESPLYPKVSGTFAQAGTDDPSPENIRSITPWLASGGTVNIVQTDGATITLTAPQEIAAGWMDNEAVGAVTGIKTTLNATEIWDDANFAASGYFETTLAVAAHGTPALACSHFLPATSAEVDSNKVIISGTSLKIYPDDAVATDKTEWLAYLAASPVTIAYTRATPVNITPASAPLTALPQLDRVTPRSNVLTASTGNVELTYAKSPIQESIDVAATITD